MHIIRRNVRRFSGISVGFIGIRFGHRVRGEGFLDVYRDHIRRPILVDRHFISNVRAEPGSNGMIQTGAYFQAVFHERGRTRLQTGCYRDVCVETPSGLRIAHKRIEVDSTVLLPQRE